MQIKPAFCSETYKELLPSTYPINKYALVTLNLSAKYCRIIVSNPDSNLKILYLN